MLDSRTRPFEFNGKKYEVRAALTEQGIWEMYLHGGGRRIGGISTLKEETRQDGVHFNLPVLLDDAMTIIEEEFREGRPREIEIAIRDVETGEPKEPEK